MIKGGDQLKEINERLRKIMGIENITQAELAEKIMVSQAYISKLFKENTDKTPSDRLIKIICSQFNVNERWLRTGEGEMFIQKSREEIMAEYAAELTFGDDEFIQNFVKKYMQLSPENKKLFRSLFKE